MNYLEKYRNEGRMPLQIGWIRGGVGKEFVVKHYGKRRVMTKYPDMSRIIASKGQRECRNLFKDAVAFAKEAIADPAKKAMWQQRLKIRQDQVFNRVIQLYMKTAKEGIMVRTELKSETVHADGRISTRVKSYSLPLTPSERGGKGQVLEMDVGCRRIVVRPRTSVVGRAILAG